MNWQVSAPSKTFLVGEYVALQGGPTLILTTAPRFELRIAACSSTTTPIKVHGISAVSPAGQFLRQTSDDWHGLELNFYDPYQGQGGFGASTAQLGMVMAFAKWRKQHQISTDAETLIQTYQNLVWNGEGTPPSGADLVAQWYGGACFFHRERQEWVKLSWSFPDIQWALIHTGQKLATHHHLRQLPKIDIVPLAAFAAQAIKGLQAGNQTEFITAIRDYGCALQQQQLVASHTLQLLARLQQRPEVLAAKGCGAMGSDVVLALIPKTQRTNLENWLRQQGFNNLFIGQETSEGVKVLVD